MEGGFLRSPDALWHRGLFTSPNLYAPPLHVVPTRMARRVPGVILAASRGPFMHDPGCELRRTTLPRTWVNKPALIAPLYSTNLLNIWKQPPTGNSRTASSGSSPGSARPSPAP